MNIVWTSSRAFWNACCTVGDNLLGFDISLSLAGVLDLLFVLLVADGILNICVLLCCVLFVALVGAGYVGSVCS